MSNRGSEWAKWDLHIHTKGTAKNDKYDDITFDDFCLNMFKKALEKDIKVIGITDYFRTTNFKKVRDYQVNIDSNTNFNSEEKSKIKKLFLVPNIELRITPSTDDNGLVNIHLLINPSWLEFYDNKFCNQLIFTYSPTEKYSISEYDLVRLGKRLNSNFTDKDNEEASKVGAKYIALHASDIINSLQANPEFKENCLVIVPNSNNDGASSFQKQDKNLKTSEDSSLRMIRESIYRLSDAIFSGNPNDAKFFAGEAGKSAEDLIAEYGGIKPCIHGSDAHDLNKLFEPDLQRYCWIKAEPTFNGLKQIIHEIHRVKIDATRPEAKNGYEVIDRIEITDENVFNQYILLNPNLSTIIGGRSSGKSTLIQAIAYKLNSSLMREGEAEKHIKSLAQNIKIFWKDGKEDYSRQVEYFYQGHMYAKSNEKGIESIVEDIQRSMYPEKYTIYKEKIDGYLQENSTNISKYLSQKQSMEQIINQISAIGKVEDIKAEIQSIELEISELNLSDVDSVQLQLHENAKNEIALLENKKVQVGYFISKINSLNVKDFVTIDNPFETDLISDEIQQTINIDSFLKNLSDELNHKINQFLFDKKHELNLLINMIDSEVSQKQSDVNYIQRELLYQANQRFKPLQERKDLEANKLTSIESYLNQFNLLKLENDKLYDELKQNLIEMEKVLNELVTELNNLSNEKIEINNKSVFQAEGFKKFIMKNIDQRSERAQEISKLEFSNTEQIIAIFAEIFESIKKDQFKLKSGVSIGNLLNEFFTTTWFEIGYDVIYDGDNYNKMSQGKKAFVVLKLTLDCSNKKCPIIIDQPEDDLDNRAIFSELVSYLKDKKTQRQIILVTHNANVVVNADSELIIVANQHGEKTPNNDEKKFEYKFGSIESMLKDNKISTTLSSKTIREHACEILEGGDQAFKLREKRYRII